MATVGDVYTNPVTGERAVVIAAEPDRLVVDLFVRAGGRVAGEHIHPFMTERFAVLGGTVGFRVGGRDDTASAGSDVVEAAAGVPHDWWNVGAEEAHVRIELLGRQAVLDKFENSIVLLFGLAHEGKVNAKGMPNPLQLAIIATSYADVIRFTSPPAFVQRTLLPLLAALGKARGYADAYPAHRALVVQNA